MPDLKPLVWVGTSKADLSSFPEDVKDLMGFALYVAQCGGKHESTKPLRGFGGASVLEVVDDFQGGAYRAIYTVRFAGRVYVLHAFQKKSKTGIKTPKSETTLIQSRLQRAEEVHRVWTKSQKGSAEHG